jgi:hypothetical protein
MATLPQFKQRQIARRSTSDIDRLAKQYKANVDALTGEYQTAFTGYQAGVAEKMKPFEAQMAAYKESLLPTYETQKAAYQKKLDEYTATLSNIEKNPVIEKRGTRTTLNPAYSFSSPYDPGSMAPQYQPQFIEEPYLYYEKKPIPKFEGAAPNIPEAPVAPAIEEFDSSKFAAKKTEVESAFKREVAERRAARLGVVSRKMTRPMLKGAE